MSGLDAAMTAVQLLSLLIIIMGVVVGVRIVLALLWWVLRPRG